MHGMKKLLSIDWDYFFPDEIGYDWGYRDTVFDRTDAWLFRVDSIDLLTKEPMIENFKPTVPGDFWKRVITDTDVPLFLADSHCMIWHVLHDQERCEVVNIDAHHDCGYEHDNVGNVNCGDWGYHGKVLGKIGRMKLVYPEWRRGNGEGRIGRVSPDQVMYELPDPQRYDAIFVCRSGSWTPPWHDKKFWKLVGKSGNLREGRRLQEIEQREPSTIKVAKQLRSERQKQIRELYGR